MSFSQFAQLLFSVPSTITLITLGNLLFANTVNAFSINSGDGITNGGFEDSLSTTWSTTGDVDTIVQNVVQANGVSVNPVDGANQAIITNAYQTTTDRVDDVERVEVGPATPLDFNQSGTNPIDADTDPNNQTGDDLQTYLGLGTNVFSIAREPIVEGVPRTPKEGSGMYQEFTINVTEQDVLDGKNSFNISFNWAYLTNDGQEDLYGLGNQDFSFFSLYDTTSDLASREINILGDSSGSILDPVASDNYNEGETLYYSSGSTYTQSVTGLSAGSYTYRIAFGVVDVDGSGRSSALLLDQFNVQQIPFEFSPSAGIGLVLGLFGIKHWHNRRNKL